MSVSGRENTPETLQVGKTCAPLCKTGCTQPCALATLRGSRGWTRSIGVLGTCRGSSSVPFLSMLLRPLDLRLHQALEQEGLSLTFL